VDIKWSWVRFSISIYLITISWFSGWLEFNTNCSSREFSQLDISISILLVIVYGWMEDDCAFNNYLYLTKQCPLHIYR
jgi:hypothetical protein